jgi:hypothetical protein
MGASAGGEHRRWSGTGTNLCIPLNSISGDHAIGQAFSKFWSLELVQFEINGD